MKSRMRIFINCKMENASFVLPSKNRLLVREKKFKTKCQIPSGFVTKVKTMLNVEANIATAATSAAAVSAAVDMAKVTKSANQFVGMLNRMIKQQKTKKQKRATTDQFLKNVATILMPHIDNDAEESGTTSVAVASAAVDTAAAKKLLDEVQNFGKILGQTDIGKSNFCLSNELLFFVVYPFTCLIFLFLQL